MKKFPKFLYILSIASLMLSACAKDMGSNVYTSSSNSGKVLEGKVISARPVTIKENDKLQDNTLGLLGGGLAGGVAGSALGKGTGRSIATVGGALLGAAGGALLQNKLGTAQGMEYIVRIDKKYISSIPTSKSRVAYGSNSVSNEVSQSVGVQDTKTDLISVVQGADITFQPGQRVLIIYNNDRPRLAANDAN